MTKQTEEVFSDMLLDELPSLQAMHAFAEAEGYAVDFSETRWHHEIYLGDPRKTDPAKLKTVLRHPVRKR